jgi:hypothetical protein
MKDSKFKVQSLKFNYFTFSPFYLFTFLPFFLLTFSSCDKEEMILKSWKLQTVLMNDEPLNDSLQFNLLTTYTYYTFFYANSLTVRTYALGQHTTSADGFYRINKSTLEMRFSLLYNRYNISAKIKKLTRRELNLEYTDNGDTYFLKFYAY